MGEDMAAFFGIKKVDKVTYAIPDADEASAAVRRYNSAVKTKDKIDISFYKPNNPRVSDLDYISHYARDGKLPIADSTRERPHDVNYHLSGIFLPPRVHQLKRAQSRALLDFGKFLDDHPKFTGVKQEYGGRWSEVVEKEALRVDSLTGGVMVVLNPKVPGNISGRSYFSGQLAHFKNQIYNPLGEGMSPDKYLRDLFRSYSAYQEALEEFISIQSKKDPLFTQSRTIDPKDLMQEIQQRIQAAQQTGEWN